MKIAELKDGMRGVNVSGMIVKIGEPKDVQTRYGSARVANAILEDETGRIMLVLWEENIDKVAVGDKVRIENGYVTSFKGKLQLNVGRYGKLIVSTS